MIKVIFFQFLFLFLMLYPFYIWDYHFQSNWPKNFWILFGFLFLIGFLLLAEVFILGGYANSPSSVPKITNYLFQSHLLLFLILSLIFFIQLFVFLWNFIKSLF